MIKTIFEKIAEFTCRAVLLTTASFIVLSLMNLFKGLSMTESIRQVITTAIMFGIGLNVLRYLSVWFARLLLRLMTSNGACKGLNKENLQESHLDELKLFDQFYFKRPKGTVDEH